MSYIEIKNGDTVRLKLLSALLMNFAGPIPVAIVAPTGLIVNATRANGSYRLTGKIGGTDCVRSVASLHPSHFTLVEKRTHPATRIFLDIK